MPIKFIFRQSEFTDEGRAAAELFLEYLLIKRPRSITMTGHADERGSHAFNMDLSSERLEAVAKCLRAGGFAGSIELIPNGDTEPSTGVDRGLLRREQLYDLDRRVELLLGP